MKLLAKNLSWQELFGRPERLIKVYLLFAFGVFAVGYFVFADYNEHYRFYGRFIFVPAVIFLAIGMKRFRPDTLSILVLLYLGYMLASSFWATPFDLFVFGQKLTITAYIVSFMAITRLLDTRSGYGFRWMMYLTLLVAAGTALATIWMFYQRHDFPVARMTNMLGSLTNINEASNVYGVCALLALGYAFRERVLAIRILLLLTVVVMVLYIWFGQSRTAFSSLLVALIVLVMLEGGWRQWRYAMVIGGIIAGLPLIFPELIEIAWSRGEGLRPAIWRNVFADAVAAPYFGHGLTAKIACDVGGHHFETSHNAFLQVFWQGGLLGLGLFVVLYFYAMYQAWRLGREQREYTILALLVFALGVMLTGVDTLIERPRDQWMLVWFPLALLLARQGSASVKYPENIETKPV